MDKILKYVVTVRFEGIAWLTDSYVREKNGSGKKMGKVSKKRI